LAAFWLSAHGYGTIRIQDRFLAYVEHFETGLEKVVIKKKYFYAIFEINPS
jgi:hypothetical protein